MNQFYRSMLFGLSALSIVPVVMPSEASAGRPWRGRRDCCHQAPVQPQCCAPVFSTVQHGYGLAAINYPAGYHSNVLGCGPTPYGVGNSGTSYGNYSTPHLSDVYSSGTIQTPQTMSKNNVFSPPNGIQDANQNSTETSNSDRSVDRVNNDRNNETDSNQVNETPRDADNSQPNENR